MHKTLSLTVNEDIEAIENEVKSVRKSGWKKYPDEPLKEVVQRNLESRKLHAGKGKTLRKKEREIIETMKINVFQKAEEIWIAEAEEFHGLKAEGKTQKEAVGKIKT